MTTLKSTTLALALAAVPALALAHPQAGGAHTHGFFDGFAHPFTGLDHLLAMLAVGIWSARQKQGSALPLAFLAAMLFGVLSGVAGLVIPGLETGIALTVAVLGVLIAVAARLPAGAGMLMVAAFAVLHGNAHGHELPQAASAFGLLLASAMLIAAGRAAAKVSPALMVKLSGAAIAATGLLLVASA
ncbi:MAG: HupE/UreJ family protein [Sphingomonadaceae bacterium]